MKLISETTGDELLVGKTYLIKVGVRAGKEVVVSELIPPTEDNPTGWVHVDKHGITYQKYYPSVLGAKIVMENEL